MPIKGLHHIRLATSDLGGGRAFAKDFGLIEAATGPDCVYLRGAGPFAYSVVLEAAAESRLAALAFEADDMADLDRAVTEFGATAPRKLDGPGGGTSVSLTDPNGFTVELVHGIERRNPDMLPAPMVYNQGYDKIRVGQIQDKSPLGPPSLLRLGHVGIFIQDWEQCDAWYRQVLGLIPSDLMCIGPMQQKIGGFYRVDRGPEYVDHHVVAMFQMPGKQGLHHLSLEVPNSEAQFMAHRWLARQEREGIWGVGRHPLGSHVFDVWRDPNGFRYETFSDTDMLNASAEPGAHNVMEMEMDLWSDRNVEIYFG